VNDTDELLEDSTVNRGVWHPKSTDLSYCDFQAMPWLKQLVAGLSLWSPGFVPGLIHVGFEADKVTLGRVFLQVLWSSPVNIIPSSFSILICHLGDEQYVQ
jgi:hypothetical protein